jgi:hypothetical protein
MVRSQPLKADSSSRRSPSSRRLEKIKRAKPPTRENTLDMMSRFRTGKKKKKLFKISK